MQPVPTYAQIIQYVRETAGFIPQPGWIVDVKGQLGLPLRAAHNRRGDRLKLCPPEKRGAIVAAFRHFGMVPEVRA